MKRLFILLIFGLLPMVAGLCPPSNALTIETKAPIRPYEALWDATCMVESSGNPHALNHKEMAVGIAQIRAIRLRDYNRRTGKSYELKDCYNTQISKEIWIFYAQKYHYTDYKTIAQRWNGSGYKTIEYWKRIKSVLKLY